MIEQIPLTFVVDDAVVVSPAAVGMLGHNQAFVFVGTHRVLTHGISQHLSVLSDVRIGQIVVAVVLKGERSFSLTAGQTFKTVHANHFHLAVTKLDFRLGVVVGKFNHVGLQLGAASVAPENVGIAVRGLEHARVDAVDALDRLRLRNERACGTVSYGYADSKSAACLRG